MFNQNVPAKFQTGKGSTYTVDATGVTRHKPADPTRKTERKEKNIYYLTDSDAGDKLLKDVNSGWKEKSVLAVMEDRFQLVLAKGGAQGFKYYEMVNKPAVGLTPYDAFMEANGALAADSAAHIGHSIEKIL